VFSWEYQILQGSAHARPQGFGMAIFSAGFKQNIKNKRQNIFCSRNAQLQIANVQKMYN
jgi:hypothetical protein